MEPTVASIMNARVITIGMDDKVADAVSRMEQTGLHKLLVLDGGEPKGILEFWLAAKMDPSKTLREEYGRYKINPSPVKSVLSDEPVSSVVSQAGEVAAFVVFDRAYPTKIAGIVTVSDFAKAL